MHHRCDFSLPDPLPNCLHGHTTFVQPHIIAVVNYPLANYQEQPSSPTNRNSCTCQPPFQCSVQQSWLIYSRNSGIKDVGHSPLPHSSRTNLVWPCPQTLRVLCVLRGSGYAGLVSVLNSISFTHTHTHTHKCKNANFLAAARRSRAPGRARMPVH